MVVNFIIDKVSTLCEISAMFNMLDYRSLMLRGFMLVETLLLTSVGDFAVVNPLCVTLSGFPVIPAPRAGEDSSGST